MMGERRVMQEALFYGFSLGSGTSPTITAASPRSIGSWTFQRSGGIWSLVTARRVVASIDPRTDDADG